MTASGDEKKGRLAVIVDGVKLPDDEARTLWERFSDWMEEHRGDLAGFAAREGFASIHPGVDGGRPVLIASKTAPQRPYGPAASLGGVARSDPTRRQGGGSDSRHGRPSGDRLKPGKPRK